MKKVWIRGGVDGWDIIFCTMMVLKEIGYLENWSWFLIIGFYVGISLLQGLALDRLCKEESE